MWPSVKCESGCYNATQGLQMLHLTVKHMKYIGTDTARNISFVIPQTKVDIQ